MACVGLPTLHGQEGMPWQGWVLTSKFHMKLALQALPPALLCHEQGWHGRQWMLVLWW